ncbi:MAG TPA: flavin reductase [Candidatus Aphodovivens excrementavium]|nr:flavin reductase [Candidatus Aphodovivens excrementavium]
MLDKKALYRLSYGLYIISTKADGLAAGCVCNTFQQVTSDPVQVSVALNKANVTTDVIRKAGRFAVSVLSEDAPMELIGTFGFHSSADTDKFAQTSHAFDSFGIPYVTEHSVSRFSAHVVSELDLGTHILFVAEVDEAEILDAGEPMTYAYYHQVKGGKTPPKASSYVAEDAAGSDVPLEPSTGGTRVAWRCTICGHIEYVDELPDDFECPICGMGKEVFEKIEV